MKKQKRPSYLASIPLAPLADKDLRQRAEELAQKINPDFPDNLSLEETQWMLHELRVHQIELEIQNEELRRTQAELEVAHERYFDLYDMAPVGYCTISKKGLILEANLTAARLLGVDRSALVKHPLSRFILKADQDIYYLYHKQLLETGKPQKCELRMIKLDGTEFWAGLTSTLTLDVGGAPQCYVVLSDITTRKHTEHEMQYQNTHDGLTGLYNRVFYQMEIERLEISRRFPVSVIMVDVDNLKKVNDTLGHNAGDDVLRLVAKILRKSFRPDDMIARLGGDEFIIILPETDNNAAQIGVKQLNEKISENNKNCPPSLKIGLSIGLATGNSNIRQIGIEADNAMYNEKRKIKPDG